MRRWACMGGNVLSAWSWGWLCRPQPIPFDISNVEFPLRCVYIIALLWHIAIVSSPVICMQVYCEQALKSLMQRLPTIKEVSSNYRYAQFPVIGDHVTSPQQQSVYWCFIDRAGENCCGNVHRRFAHNRHQTITIISNTLYYSLGNLL